MMPEASNVISDETGSEFQSAGYAGGKGNVYHRLIRLMPPHKLYIEPFLGHGAVLRRKRPAEVNIGIDVDAGVAAWWNQHRRLWPRHTKIIRGDAMRTLASLLTRVDEQTLVNVDPPYLIETRTRLFYEHEFETPEQHTALLTLLIGMARHRGAMVMISGYPSTLYETMLEHHVIVGQPWNVLRYKAMTRGGLRDECCGYSFPAPGAGGQGGGCTIPASPARTIGSAIGSSRRSSAGGVAWARWNHWSVRL